MMCSNFKVLFLISMGLTLLFAPFSLEISPGGETYAMANWFSQDRSNNDSSGNVHVTSSEQSPGTPPLHPTPEPATLLLFGAGAAGLAAFKKFRKK